MATRLLTMKDVRELTRLGETKVREMIDAGKFPRARQVGPRAVRWRLSDVEAWIESLPEATGRPPRRPIGMTMGGYPERSGATFW